MLEIQMQCNKIVYNEHGSRKEFDIIDLPAPFIQWQSDARVAMFQTLETTRDASKIKMQPAHLPVFATTSEGLFPINLSTRGIGLVPRATLIESWTSRFVEMQKITREKPLHETLPDRVAIMKEFYASTSNLDTKLLGGLEIFEGKTAANIQRVPIASLLYTGQAPKYPSYQFNGFIARVEPGDPHYQFLLAARELFAMDSFHIHQTKYPFGYLFYPVEIQDKTPFSRMHGEKPPSGHDK